MLFQIVREDGLRMQLDPSQTITVEKNNPLFNTDGKLLQDISWGSTAPFSEQNALFFNYGHLVERSNEWYIFPIVFYASGDRFLTGNIKYRVGTGGYEFNLQPNLVAINSLITNITMTDVRAKDAVFSGITGSANYAAFAAMMKDACINPDKYPYYFFPIYNPSFNTGDGYTSFQECNHYDELTEEFSAALTCPFFKLTYIYKVLANYLGLSPTGNFFVDEKMKSIAIYTREFKAGEVFNGAWIDTSNNYMPGMLISNFFTQTIQRLHIALDMNLTDGLMEVETFRSIANSEPIDISKYVCDPIEQELPDSAGSTVTLKSDDQDESFAVVNGDETTYPALFKLVAGDGANTIELECSTLRSTDIITGTTFPGRTLTANQLLYDGFHSSDINTDLPASNNLADYRQWPLRLVQWLGYNTMSTGRKYPEAGPLELDDDDILYYRFLNDSKRLIITAYFPPAVIAGLKTTRKYVFKTAGYNYCEIIIEKISYDINPDDELIATKIYARTLKFDIQTPVTIVPLSNATTDDFANVNGNTPNIMALVKAYFDTDLHGIDQVEFEVYSPAGVPLVWKAPAIVIPANFKGAGGTAVGVYWISGAFTSDYASTTEIRIRQGVPKYVMHNGIKTAFAYNSTGGYYYAPLFDWRNEEFQDYFTILF